MVSLTLKHIEELALLLPVQQRQELIARLSESLSARSGLGAGGDDKAARREPKRLFGDWKNRFPENFDIDAALREIRQQWTRNDAT